MQFSKLSIRWVWIHWLSITVIGYGQVFAHKVKTTNISSLANLVTVGPDGDVRPFFWNPAFRNPKSQPIKHVPPEPKATGRIIGGKTSFQGEVPYQVAIYLKTVGFICGGSIYNRRTLLSAAHCFFDGYRQRPAKEFIFAVGQINTKEFEGTEMQRLASEIITHPKYDKQMGLFDIAVIKLVQPLRYTFHVQPLALGNPSSGAKAKISGWGYTIVRDGEDYDEAGYHESLTATEINIITREECVNAWNGPSFAHAKTLAEHPNYICAGVKEGGRDSCSGDSGGPLACLGANAANSKSLCGIISTGVGCGLPGRPGFYMNITMFKKWIEQHGGKGDIPKRTK